MQNDVAVAYATQPIDQLLQRQALGGQCESFVVCDYLNSVFYGKSETPVCPHLLCNPRRNQGRPQIKEGWIIRCRSALDNSFCWPPPQRLPENSFFSEVEQRLV